METDRPIKEVLQRIAFECQESGASKWQVLKILKELEEFEGNEQQIRRKAAQALERLNPEAAKTFLSFEKMRVYTSGQKLEPFDRGNIIKSLLRETGISRHVAEKIGGEVEDKVKDLKIGYLNTQIIREMVNVKLLEYGHEPVHSQYARIGLPVYEVRKKLDSGEFGGDEILSGYNWLAGIPPIARELHFESLIHIFAPQDFSTKVSCASKFVHGKTLDAALEAKRADFFASSPITLSAFNFTIAGVGKITKSKMPEECAKISKAFELAGRNRHAELSLFTDTQTDSLSSKKNDAIRAANGLLANGSEPLKFYVSLDSKYQLKLLEKKAMAQKISIAGAIREKTALFGPAIISGKFRGALQVVAVNLEKVAEKTPAREERFFEKIWEIKSEIKELCEKKAQILRQRPYFEKWMVEDTANVVCLSGLLNAADAIEPDNRARILEEAIMSFARDEFVVCETLDAQIIGRFAVSESREQTQKALLEMSAKARRAFGFKYLATSAKEAENLINEVPVVEFSAKQSAHSLQ